MALINEGLQYRLLIDPFLDRVHSRAAAMIDPGARVIDVACGNGTLAVKMAERAGHVTGIDISEGSLRFARHRARKLGLDNTEFRVQDANDLSALSNPSFDVATISMAVHQFSPETGPHILGQLKTIARAVVVIDYAHPQPKNFSGFIVRTIERIAGREHFAHFKAYQRGRGMEGILERMDLEASEKVVSNSGIFVVMKFTYQTERQ
jgi:SAM-dependent methyltransferase